MDALNLYGLKGLDFFDMDKESPFDWRYNQWSWHGIGLSCN